MFSSEQVSRLETTKESKQTSLRAAIGRMGSSRARGSQLESVGSFARWALPSANLGVLCPFSDGR
jgi:hypothetical protein